MMTEREVYQSRFDSPATADEFEQCILRDGEFGANHDTVPSHAQRVREGSERTPRYWWWLHQQASAAGVEPLAPCVGMPVTVCHPNDSHAGEIVAVAHSLVTVRSLGRDDVYSLRKSGDYRMVGESWPYLLLGAAVDYCSEGA
jgi:hypothetical protein